MGPSYKNGVKALYGEILIPPMISYLFSNKVDKNDDDKLSTDEFRAFLLNEQGEEDFKDMSEEDIEKIVEKYSGTPGVYELKKDGFSQYLRENCQIISRKHIIEHQDMTQAEV